MTLSFQNPLNLHQKKGKKNNIPLPKFRINNQSSPFNSPRHFLTISPPSSDPHFLVSLS